MSVEQPRKESRDWLVDHVEVTACACDVGETAKYLQPACGAMSFLVGGVKMSVQSEQVVQRWPKTTD